MTTNTTTSSFVGKKAERAAAQALAASLPLQHTLSRMIDEKLIANKRTLARANEAIITPGDVTRNGGILEALRAKLIGGVCGDVDRFVSWTFDDIIVFMFVSGICAPMVLDLEASGEKTVAKVIRTTLELLKNHPALDIDPKGITDEAEAERCQELDAMIQGMIANQPPSEELSEHISVLRSYGDPATFARAVRAALYLHCRVAQAYGLTPKRFYTTVGSVWAQEG